MAHCNATITGAGARAPTSSLGVIHGAAKSNFPPFLQEELYGKRVMIVGYGSIGLSIEERLLPFGVDIVRVARSARAGVDRSNAFSICCPLLMSSF